MELFDVDPGTRAALLSHPIRTRLVLALAGRELTTQELAGLLPDVPRTSLYRHVRELVKGGVFVEVGEEAIRGTVEKRYAVHYRSATLSKEDVLEGGHDEYLRLANGVLGSFLETYQRYLTRQEGSLYENVLLRANAVHMTEAEFQAFRKQLTDLLTAAQALPPTPERRRRLVGLISVPDESTPSIEP